MTHHDSSGRCPRCLEILSRYPGFSSVLKAWFIGVQSKVTNFHVSCGGRGRQDQEDCVAKGVSKAGYSQSGHNWNCALDGFFQINGQLSYDRALYEINIVPLLTCEIVWYGAPGAAFPELPHFEQAGWQNLAQSGKVNLVE